MLGYRFYVFMLVVLVSNGVYASEDNAAATLCGAGECHRTGKVGAKNACQCYCSHKCGPREWQDDDPGFYVQNDPHGKGCYCKPWDYNNFNTSDFGKSCAVVEQERKEEPVKASKNRKSARKKSVL